MRKPLGIAVDLGRCASSWEPHARLLGNIRADELAFLARIVLELHAAIMSSETFDEHDRMRLLALLCGDDL